ncbi:YegP family protein [Sphingomonas sp.]|jgi:uncharacterized protein YegP (UPF0339 family)|uniref:YegP family protein n=1 Tax=Sphingomonas sp. TaxID=28214 RepID=UPI00356137BF
MKFEVYDGNDHWYWRLRARNGKIIADSGESYTTRGKCLAAIKRVQKCADAKVVST